jgi:hypothetical protein
LSTRHGRGRSGRRRKQRGYGAALVFQRKSGLTLFVCPSN